MPKCPVLRQFMHVAFSAGMNGKGGTYRNGSTLCSTVVSVESCWEVDDGHNLCLGVVCARSGEAVVLQIERGVAMAICSVV